MKRGDELLERVANGRNGLAANELLAEFFRGYPIEKLRRLLYSDDDHAVQTGAFIASELGDRFAPLMGDVIHLMDHRIKAVRFDSLDVVLVNATDEHGEIVARAVMLIRDQDEGVRWKALDFLARASRSQLIASMAHLSDSALATQMAWLASEASKSDVMARLRNDDQLARMFAAAAAARLSPYDLAPLERAAASDDGEVRSFAQTQLEALRAHPAHRDEPPSGG